ncbi:ribose-phosphate pyrophosphokinase-like domain-containing protein [Sorangium sp. So ce1036]
MDLCLFTGTANPPLAQAVAARLGVGLGDALVRRFADGELHVQLRQSVRGQDVYLLQPTSPPVDEHLLELLFLADACRRAGAARLTAGGTIEAAVKALLAAGCAPDLVVLATHALLVGPATARLSALPVRRFLATDSVVAAACPALPAEIVRLDGLLAEAIRLLHDGGSLEGLLAHGGGASR